MCSKFEIQTNEISTQCGNFLCDNKGGICVSENGIKKCVCGKKYEYSGNIKCSYEKKSKEISFILELFLPFGMGHLYSLRYVNFLIKGILFISIIPYKRSHINEILIVVFCIINVLDLLGFISGIYRDGNNINLY